MATLRVAAAHRPPFVFIDPSRSGQAAYYGLIVELLPILLQTAGLGNYTLEYYSSTNSGGEKLPNGTWTGIMGELQQRRADVAAFPLTLVPGRPTDIDITYSYISDGVGLLVQKGQAVDDPLLFLAPFDAKLWVALLGGVFAVALFQKLISLYTPFGDLEIHEVHPHVEHGTFEANTHIAGRKYEVENLSGSMLLETWLALFGERRGLMVGRSWAPRIFAIAFSFFGFVIMAAYTANFASLLTVQLASQPIQSLSDLSARNSTVAINPGGATKSYFDHTQDPISADVGSRRTYAKDVLEGVAMVRNGSVDAFITDAPTLQYAAGRVPCDLTMVGNNFGPGALVYGLQKGSALTRPLNDAMLVLYDNGKLDKLRRSWGGDIAQCSAKDAGGIANSQLSLAQFTGLFYMMLVFAAAAFLWASGEHVAFCIAKRHPPLHKAATAMQCVSGSRELQKVLRKNNSFFNKGNSSDDEGIAKAGLHGHELPRSQRSLMHGQGSTQHDGVDSEAAEHGVALAILNNEVGK